MDILLPDCRHDTTDLFRLSGLFTGEKLNHGCFIALIPQGESVEVRLIRNSYELLGLEDNTDVLVQWQGKWRSDFFKFKAGEYKNYKSN